MDILRTHSGKLRAIGYDVGKRILRVQLEDGSTLEYQNVSESVWRNLKGAGSQWSYYRDNIEDEFTATRLTTKPAVSVTNKNPLDDLFS